MGIMVQQYLKGPKLWEVGYICVIMGNAGILPSAVVHRTSLRWFIRVSGRWQLR